MPRIDVTVSEPVRLWVEKTATAEGRSMAQVVSRLLEASKKLSERRKPRRRKS